MPAASIYGVVLMTMMGAIGFWGASRLNAELRRSYPSEWEYLGRPTPLSGKSIGQELRWIGFVVLRRYRKFRDPRLSRFGDLVFLCGLTNVSVLIAFPLIPHSPL
jgi:hypothetical protein